MRDSLEKLCTEHGVGFEGTRDELLAAAPLLNGRAFPGDAGARPRKVRFPDGVVLGRAPRGRFWAHIPHACAHQAAVEDAAFRGFLARVLPRA